MIFLISTALFSFILGVYVLFKNTKNTLHVLFFILSIFSTFWITTNVLAGLLSSLFWIKGAYAFGSLASAMALIWNLYLTRWRIKKLYYYLIIFSALSFFTLPYIDGLILKQVDFVYLGGFVGELGPIFPFYAAFQFVLLMFMVLVTFLAYRWSVGSKKEQLKYVFIGVTTTALIVLTVSFILPLFGIIRYTYLDSPSFIIFLSCITYSITRHKLMDIRLVITRSILYTILVVLVATFFALVVLLAGRYFGTDTQVSNVAVYLVVSAIIVLFLDPVKRVFARITDKIFYKDKIDYQQVLQEVASVLATEIDLEKLLQKFVEKLATRLKIKKVSVWVPTNN